MKLEAEGQRAIVNPQANDIESAASLLSLTDRKFLILSRSDAAYVQAMIVGSNRLALEYRDGGAEQHFRSARDDLSTGVVVEILEAYRRGEDSWWREIEWRRIEVSPRRDRWDSLSLFSKFIALVLALDSGCAVRARDGDPIFGLEPMEVLSLAMVALMASAIIDLRKFRTMDSISRGRSISAIVVGLFIVTIYLLERFRAR